MKSFLLDPALWRRLLRQPTFTLAVVLTIALAIAANTALFTVVHSVILRQLPFENPDELLWIWNRRVDRDKAFFSVPDFVDYQAQTETLQGIAAWANWGANLGGTGEPERLLGLRITANAFTLLGAHARLGKVFMPLDGQPGAAKVVIFTHGLWLRRFGGDTAIVGKTILLNDEKHYVIGVLSPHFFFPGSEAELAVPLIPETDPRRQERDSNFLRVFARRKPQSTLAQVQSEMDAIGKRLREVYPENAKKTTPRVFPLHEEVVGNYRLALLILWGAVGLVLLVACANLAGLYLAHCAQREREVAVRAALGASRRRLVGELLSESLLLAILGGVLGVILAAWGTRVLLTLTPSTLPRLSEIGLDSAVLAYSLAATLATGLLLGIAPALQYGRPEQLEILRAGRGAASRGAERFRSALVVSQVALAMVLCVGAGWMARSFQQVQAVQPGLRTDGLLLMRLSLPGESYSDLGRTLAFLERLFFDLQTLPGVRSATAANVVPLSAANVRSDFMIVGRPPASPTDIPGAQMRWVMPGYFQSLGIPVLEGRGFMRDDTMATRRVVIIDQALARSFFATENPIGASIRFGDSEPAMEIVGVVGNVKHFSIEEEPLPTLYAPIPQIGGGGNNFAFLRISMFLAVRVAGEPATLADVVRTRVRALDPGVPASSVTTMEKMLDTAVAPRRFNMQLILAFAIATAGLAAMGLYALQAYTIAQTRRDIGIRLALGAQPGDIFRHVLGKAIFMTGTGIAMGGALALAASRAITGMLFAVRPTEPVVLAGSAGLLALALLSASYMPARRAARTDPNATLRQE